MAELPALKSPAPPAAGADLADLLAALDTNASLVQRHIWLITLFQWIRGDGRSAAAAAGRVDILLDVLDARPQLVEHFRAWWQVLLDTVDEATLLSDYGFASRNAFVSELVERLHRKLLPATPETADAAELFSLVLPSPVDALWIEALSPASLERIAALLTAPAQRQPAHAPRALTQWQESLIEGITFCTSNIGAVGFSPDIRVRMSTPARAASPFHTLAADFEALRDAWWASLPDPGADHTMNEAASQAANAAAQARFQDAAVQFKAKLEACRQSAASVYSHLDAHGISMDLVFRLRQLRERVLRIRALLDCLVSETPLTHSAKLIANLARVGQEQRSISALVSSNTSLLAAKVAERSSETGEHYITRNRAEYRAMLRQAAGGGALTAGTTALKFGDGCWPVCVLDGLLVGRDVRRQLCAHPVTALHAGHQTARHDGARYGGQAQRHQRPACRGVFCGRGDPPGALAVCCRAGQCGGGLPGRGGFVGGHAGRNRSPDD